MTISGAAPATTLTVSRSAASRAVASRLTLSTLLLVLAALVAAGCAGDAGEGEVPVPPATRGGSSASPAPSAEFGPLDVEVVTDRLEHGWDIGFLPYGQILISERPARFTLLSSGRPGATATRVEADLSDVYVEGEGGLLGMVIHPDFATSRLFTTCLDHQEDSRPVDIRLVTWRLAEDGRSADRVKELLTGLPVAVGGRHSGCRPTIGPDGALWVGTGDTARPDVPQDLTQLGGKVLRLDLTSGKPMPDNPFITAADPRQRYVYTYGHRNIQGVAARPGTDQVFTVEHGPDVNDEVNLLRPGGNYGWDPSRAGTVDWYDESVPMTDLKRFPDAVPAVWQTGGMTEATCSAAFLEGEMWGEWEGRLVVTALKGAKLVVLTLSPSGAVTGVAVPDETNGPYGRLRAARTGPDGALYVTTTNGVDDKLLRITPR